MANWRKMKTAPQDFMGPDILVAYESVKGGRVVTAAFWTGSGYSLRNGAGLMPRDHERALGWRHMPRPPE